jgi:hypothetical protein
MSEFNANKERRRHVRTQPNVSKVINLFYLDASGNKVDLPSSVVDESLNGIAVIFVGNFNLSSKFTIYWQETDKICTACSLIYIKEIDEGVKRLALEIHGQACFASN